MSITTDSVDKAAKLSQIGFPEFTAKLVTDTFNALISANMSQTEAYIKLTEELAKTLTDYINDTKDDISGSDVLNFLIRIVPDQTQLSGTIINKDSTKKLTTEQANKINDAVSIPNTTMNSQIANTSSQIKDLYVPILDAIAARIAADKYTLLQQMVKLGLVRMIVNGGEINTALNFEAKDSTFYQTRSSDYNRKEYNFSSDTRNGVITALWNRYSTSTNYSTLGVSAQNTVSGNASASSVQISGSVRLTFSTDYQSLGQLTQ